MKSIVILGGGATFLSGVAISLLASYPISQHNVYVCFVALLVGVVACGLAVGAFVLYATQHVNDTTRAERVRVDHLVKLTVDEMLKRRGLELVDRE